MDGQTKDNDDINQALLMTTSARGVLTFCEFSASEFDVTNALTALHRLAKASDRRFYKNDPRWPGIIGRAHQMLIETCTDENAWPRLSKEYLLNAAWSFSMLGHRDDYLFEIICEEALALRDLSPNDLVGLVRARANLKIEHTPVMDKLLEEARRRVGQFRPAQLSGLSWSLATLSFKDDDLMDQISKETISKVRLFQPRQLTELAWAFATLGVRKPALNGAMTDATIGRIDEFRTGELANIAHAFVQLSAGSESVMEVIADKLSMRTADLEPDGIEKVAWALVAVNYVDEALVVGLAAEVVARFEAFPPSRLAAVAASLASLGAQERSLIDAVKDLVASHLDELRATDLAKLVTALVDWEAKEELEGPLHKAVLEKMSKLGPHDLVEVANAYKLHGNSSLLSELMEGIARHFSSVSECASADHWVKIGTLVATYASDATRCLFESQFTMAVLRPLQLQLEELSGTSRITVRSGPPNGCFTALEQFVQMAQLESLGPYFTRTALLGQQMLPLSRPIIKPGELHKVALADPTVAACWDLRWGRTCWVEPSARLFSCSASRGGISSQLLPPLRGLKVEAGRHALLHTAALVSRRCPEQRLHEVQGCLQIFASETPGIDTLVALCQFQRLFPGVRLEVDYVS
mmetsp:Transcript_48363/g.121858  ORF Transcript_48363/g.121858 Transcript_48363/m.121858 type:complete len:639 (+) Transcript_48363:303-2219(+)